MADPDLIKRMGECPLFQDLSSAELAAVADAMRQDHFPTGDEILREGEEGMGFFFVVLDGAADVLRHGSVAARLKPGDFFGEITSLNGGPRTASVRSTEPLWTLGLTDHDFRPFLERFPKVTFRILEQVCRRFQALATNAS
jgi:CRP-like cAMP-binding protein